MPIEEAIYVYEMNRNIKAVIDTPHGRTEEIQIDEAVRQGTIFGTTMCGVSINRINKMGRPDPLILHESIEIECPIFVDDISGMGKATRIENIGEKMAGLETTKKVQFNNNKDKTEYLIQKNSKEKIEEVGIKVMKGEVGRTKEYKCLGDYYDETGNNEIKIQKKMEKANFMAFEVKRRGAYATVGRADMSVQLLLLDTVIKETLLANTETWCNITNKEEAMITSKHHSVLCILFGQPKSTPYFGILGETGIWPYKYIIKYKMLMFLHHIVHSSDDRMAKRIILRQQQMLEEHNKRRTWYFELNEWIEVMKIDISIRTKELENKTKSKWKKELKEKLAGAIEREFQDETEQKTKLRFQRNKLFQREEYVQQCNAEMVQRIMKIRLNMVECKSNFKGKYSDTTCLVCDKEETTEHLFECEHYKQYTGIHNELEELKMESTEWLIKAARKMDVIQELRLQHTEQR